MDEPLYTLVTSCSPGPSGVQHTGHTDFGPEGTVSFFLLLEEFAIPLKTRMINTTATAIKNRAKTVEICISKKNNKIFSKKC